MKLCSRDEDLQCVENMQVQDNTCLRPCEGVYVDVKKSPVEVVQVPHYHLLMKDYAKHTWFHEKNVFENDMKNMQGNSETSTFNRYLNSNLFRTAVQIPSEVCENLL